MLLPSLTDVHSKSKCQSFFYLKSVDTNIYCSYIKIPQRTYVEKKKNISFFFYQLGYFKGLMSMKKKQHLKWPYSATFHVMFIFSVFHTYLMFNKQVIFLILSITAAPLSGSSCLFKTPSYSDRSAGTLHCDWSTALCVCLHLLDMVIFPTKPEEQ